MKKLLFLFVLFCSLALAGQALAIPTLSLRPGVFNTQSMIGAVPGGIARVPLIIKELEPNSELPLIGAFDLEITYNVNANILAFDSVTFYESLGDPDLDQGPGWTSFETDIFVDDSD